MPEKRQIPVRAERHLADRSRSLSSATAETSRAKGPPESDPRRETRPVPSLDGAPYLLYILDASFWRPYFFGGDPTVDRIVNPTWAFGISGQDRMALMTCRVFDTTATWSPFKLNSFSLRNRRLLCRLGLENMPSMTNLRFGRAMSCPSPEIFGGDDRCVYDSEDVSELPDTVFSEVLHIILSHCVHHFSSSP
ncbi:hypothetical protein FHL15_004403 [Xylaria flabelliformis]|uniref:Uncharacterized protein n=1 Tax=Xylaria flabelliformis TaxID=2512241 RepID=A0A553I351_9PEZI|nr:hypothetical protein FHL15_004403 [Xylaria flabelliformis]